MSTLPLRLCLVGAGIARSPSPVMQQAAMQSSGVEGTYVLRDLAPDDIEGFVAELREGRYTGCNVTAPYKAVMAARCDRLEGDRRCGVADVHGLRDPAIKSIIG